MKNTFKPLVTVIVAAYNHEAWVTDSILGIVNQTYGYENIQLIVTDDSSTDRTPAILSELSSKYEFELILHNQNKGISATLNEMISRSKGEYISGIASDDIMLSDKIEKQVNLLKANPQIDILAGMSILIDKNGKEIPTKSHKFDNALISYNFEDLFLRLKPGFAAGSAIIKRELYQRIGMYDPNFMIEDYYFWLKAAYNNANIQLHRSPVFFYRITQSSFSANIELMDAEIIKILELYKKHPKYSKALINQNFQNLTKIVFSSKAKALFILIKKPRFLLYKKAYRIIQMIILPKFILKLKFGELYFRYGRNRSY